MKQAKSSPLLLPVWRRRSSYGSRRNRP